MIAALIIGISPNHTITLGAEAIQGAGSCVLGQAIAAITLALSGREVLGERLDRNAQTPALVSIAAVAATVAIGTLYQHCKILFITASARLAGLVALATIRRSPPVVASSCADHRAAPTKSVRPAPVWGLLVVLAYWLLIFGLWVFLLFVGNACLLPLAANAIARTGPNRTELIAAVAIIAPQLLAIGRARLVGRQAHLQGRRIVPLVRSTTIDLSALCLAVESNQWQTIVIQGLDGIRASVVGVPLPLVVFDITHQQARLNLEMGIVGLLVGRGAAVRTALSRLLAHCLGDPGALLARSTVGLPPRLIMQNVLSETGHTPSPKPI